jgi:hypothetical protein
MEVTLDTINAGIKTGMPLVKAITGDMTSGDLAWIDKIANILDKVTQFAKVYQQAQGGQSQNEALRDPPEGMIIENPSFRQLPEAQPKEGNNMDAIKILIPIFEQFIDKCIAENPKMSIGQAISRMDIINISEAKQLLNKYKQGLK